MDPVLDAFTARYLGVPQDEFQLALRGRAGRPGRRRTTGRSPFAPGHRPAGVL